MYQNILATWRWQTADHNEWPNRTQQIRRFLFKVVGMITLDRNYWDVTNLLFVSPILFVLKYTWDWENIAISERKILDVG